MPIIRHTNAPDAAWTHRAEHEGYAYEKQELVSRREAKQCTAAMMRIPPKKAGYPYHFHILNEECFFILSGVGLLRSPECVGRSCPACRGRSQRHVQSVWVISQGGR